MANVKTERSSEVREEKSRREPLTRERIIRAALRIMDEEGFEAVSMRRIGRELGVEAMSLYNHVQDKEDILEFVTLELGLMVGGPDDEAHAQAHQEMARLLASADLPRMREAMPHFMNCDLADQFDFGLDLLIEGIRARIAVSL